MPDSLEQVVKGDVDSEEEVGEDRSNKDDEIQPDDTENEASEDGTSNATIIDIPEGSLQSIADVESDMDGVDDDDEVVLFYGWRADGGVLSEGG